MYNSDSLANAASDPYCDEPPYVNAFSNLPGIRAFFFSARGGVSDGIYRTASGHLGLNCALGGRDDESSKTQNRQCVADTFGIAAHHLLTTRQDHFDVRLVKKPWNSFNRPDHDALVTTRPDLALGILTADCAPILLAAANKTVVATIHAGWRGVMHGLLEKTIKSMVNQGAEQEAIVASIGPCAGVKDTYEITADHAHMCIALDERVNDYVVQKDEQIFFRFQDYLAHRLRDNHIGDVTALPIDTIENPDYYSKRRDKQASRLMFSGIMIEGPR